MANIKNRISAGEINISAKELKNLVSKFSFGKILNELHSLIIAKKIDFPYHCYFMRNPFIIFEELKSFKPKCCNKEKINIHDPFPNSHFSITDLKFYIDPEGGYSMNILSDYFTEKNRMKAKRADSKLSPIELWNDKNYLKHILVIILKNNKSLNTFNLRETIYLTAKECSQFKLTTAITAYQVLKGTKILDISAGWGDRLLSAISQNAEYIGFDPNIELKPGHSKMIEMFGDKNKQRVIYAPFEKSEMPKYKPDLIFTSPPYFDYEIYTDKGEQSIKNYNSFESWMKNFLFVAFKKAWSILVPGGNMGIHLNDTYNYRFVEPMVLYCTGYLKDCVFLDSIVITGNQRDVPIWVFKKKINSEREKSRKIFKQNYGFL